MDARVGKLITHALHDQSAFEKVVRQIRQRINNSGDSPEITVAQSLALLDNLVEFELGRFLLTNRGLNGYWTHQIVTYEKGKRVFVNELERQVFEELPLVVATRERFSIFRRLLQNLLASGKTLASLPCGLMGDLLTLNYSNVRDVSLVGIDLDQASLDAAAQLAQTCHVPARLRLHCADAWDTGLSECADVLTSNGLNIYERDDRRIAALYRSFSGLLKPGGILVTSFQTAPPVLSPHSPWKMDRIDPSMLRLQKVIFAHVLDAKWNACRTHEQMRQQLEEVGFVDIEFVDDFACLFPTVLAYKAG